LYILKNRKINRLSNESNFQQKVIETNENLQKINQRHSAGATKVIQSAMRIKNSFFKIYLSMKIMLVLKKRRKI
jgi:hypothetical protein